MPVQVDIDMLNYCFLTHVHIVSQDTRCLDVGKTPDTQQPFGIMPFSQIGAGSRGIAHQTCTFYTKNDLKCVITVVSW